MDRVQDTCSTFLSTSVTCRQNGQKCIPRDILASPYSVPAACRVISTACYEIHFRHDVYPWDLEVDHGGHSRENSTETNAQLNKGLCNMAGRLPEELVFILHELRFDEVCGAYPQTEALELADECG